MGMPRQRQRIMLTLAASANIACGFHAGDAQNHADLRVREALKNGAATGAQPLPDRGDNLDDLALVLPPERRYTRDALYQIGARWGDCSARRRRDAPCQNRTVCSYNQAAKDPAIWHRRLRKRYTIMIRH